MSQRYICYLILQGQSLIELSRKQIDYRIREEIITEHPVDARFVTLFGDIKRRTRAARSTSFWM